MITLIKHLIAIFVLILASITDIKKREVPDWLNYGLIISALIINIIYSIFSNSFLPIISSILGLLFFLLISAGMFYTGQWGGGDTKLLIGLGALLGFEIQNTTKIILSILQKQFIIDFFINLLFVGAIYGTLYSLALAIKNKTNFLKAFKKKYAERRILLIFFILLTGTTLLITIFFRFKFIILNIFLLTLFMLLILLLFTLFLKSVEETCMYKLISPEKLTEGDWIAKEIKIKNKVIASPSDLGVSEEQIKELIKLYKKRKIKKVLIKEGMPFVPSFLIAYLLTLLMSNNLLRFLTEILIF